jgi:LmbE family N-acetylglucosaminyl deacetylase
VGRSGTVAVVVAHPDDDAYGFGGVAALHGDRPDFRFVLVHATDGEMGDIKPGFPATRETLGSVRRAEDKAAWRAHGRVPDRHEWLGLPDGGLAGVPFDDLVDRVAAILEEESPEVVVTFGPDGVTAHPDHITVGAAADAAFGRLAGAGRPGFRRLAHCVIPESVFNRWQDQRTALGLPVFDPTQVYHGRGVPDEHVDVTIDCSAVADRIVTGLLEHQSQLHVMADDPIDLVRLRRVVARAWFHLAWPPRPAGAPMLTDLFDGLPDAQPG